MNLGRALRVLNTVDCVLTLFCFWTYGPEAEVNPLMRWLLERSWVAFVVLKLTVVGLASVCAPRWLLAASCVVYVIACAAGAAALVSGL